MPIDKKHCDVFEYGIEFVDGEPAILNLAVPTEFVREVPRFEKSVGHYNLATGETEMPVKTSMTMITIDLSAYLTFTERLKEYLETLIREKEHGQDAKTDRD